MIARILGGIVILSASTPPSTATDWRNIRVNAEGSRIDIDLESVSRSGDVVDISSRYQRTDGTGSVWRTTYDCRLRASLSSHVDNYNADGSYDWGQDVGSGEPQPILPGTDNEAIFNAACNSR